MEDRSIDTELVEVLPQNDSLPWQPIVGNEASQLIEQFDIPSSGRDRILQEAIAIMTKCTPPTGPVERVTGLVVGYVQSGKTMSFTTVAALARDNHYPLVIVMAGTSTPLLKQSTDRLTGDLRLATREDRKWQHFESRNFSDNDLAKFNNDVTKINNTLAEWRDPTVPDTEKKTVLITVMKHHRHLEKVRLVLQKISSIDRIPTLIIDDEADQASLNSKVNDGDTSTTYAQIVSLKDVLPHHTFIQYTATPQAPLLINLIDVLSPRFVKVLTPGDGYTGGKTFFVDRPQLITIIPENEISNEDNQLDAPPDSLLFAMRTYFLGVAAGLAKNAGKGNRSMMVHPSHKTIPHEECFRWIGAVIRRWQEVLELSSDDPDRQNEMEEFRLAYNDLMNTVQDIPSFEILSGILLRAIRGTVIEEVNARNGKTPTINWKNSYANILVGGQAMDRGFTVEGLTVTYMPRGSGIGNADTIQQRARFFGYKRGYIDFCRVFLENRVREAFKNYVLHEEDIRKRLIEHDRSGLPLIDWKRAFFLNRRLAPTRRGVIDLDYMRGNFRNEWFDPKAPHESPEAVNSNREVIEVFLKSLNLQDDDGNSRRTVDQRHKVASNVPLSLAYKQLLIQLRMTRLNDSQKFTGALLQINEHLEKNPEATCTLFLMKGGELRDRTTNDKDEIRELFQGRNPKTGQVIYPGDRNILGKQGVTIQIHNLRIISGQNTFDNVPTVAVHIPEELSREWLVQTQNSLQYRESNG